MNFPIRPLAWRLPKRKKRAFPAAGPLLFLGAAAGLLGAAQAAASAGNRSIEAETAYAQAGGTPPNVVVIFTDDHGWADLGVQGIVPDAKTPHIDALAQSGIRFTHGYVTAPVCGPSRLSLLSGRYQQDFAVETNSDLPFRYAGTPLPARLRDRGYATGMFGKLHLPIAGRPHQHPADWGFTEFAMRSGDIVNAPYRLFRTHNDAGEAYPNGPRWEDVEGYRVDVTFRTAEDFIERNHERPFFAYIAPLAPHVPLEAPDKYLNRFPYEPEHAASDGQFMPEGRRYGLAMISAIDDGVGNIVRILEQLDVRENTLVFFISDNGATYEFDETNRGAPIESLKRWDGSLNTPLRGEKGILAEGGIRVPFIASWPARLPRGVTSAVPVSTLDVAPTVANLAGAGTANFDGLDMAPLFQGDSRGFLERPLFWSYGSQTAIRAGEWKLIRTEVRGDYLFNVTKQLPEYENVLGRHPETARQLRERLVNWLDGIEERGIRRQAQWDLDAFMFRKHLGEGVAAATY